MTGILSQSVGEVWILRGSLLTSGSGFLAMTRAQRYTEVILATLFFVLGNALLRPALASLISKRTTSGQGMAMGLNNAFMSLGRILGPAWAGAAFDWGIQIPYYSGAIIMAFGLLISLRWMEPRQAAAAESPPAA